MSLKCKRCQKEVELSQWIDLDIVTDYSDNYLCYAICVVSQNRSDLIPELLESPHDLSVKIHNFDEECLEDEGDDRIVCDILSLALYLERTDIINAIMSHGIDYSITFLGMRHLKPENEYHSTIIQNTIANLIKMQKDFVDIIRFFGTSNTSKLIFIAKQIIHMFQPEIHSDIISSSICFYSDSFEFLDLSFFHYLGEFGFQLNIPLMIKNLPYSYVTHLKQWQQLLDFGILDFPEGHDFVNNSGSITSDVLRIGVEKGLILDPKSIIKNYLVRFFGDHVIDYMIKEHSEILTEDLFELLENKECNKTSVVKLMLVLYKRGYSLPMVKSSVKISGKIQELIDLGLDEEKLVKLWLVN